MTVQETSQELRICSDSGSQILTYSWMKKNRMLSPTRNLIWRDHIWKMGFQEKGLRDDILQACSKDFLFFVNTFLYLYEARPSSKRGKFNTRCIPFVTFPFQNTATLDIIGAVGDGEDRLIEKSRDMGATWSCLSVFFWMWMFEYEASFLLLSAKDELVEQSGNPRALFTKLDYLYKRLPGWMRPKRKRTGKHMENEVTGSFIDGEATTPNTSVGDRRTAVLLDEFAKVENKEANLGMKILGITADVSDCRIFNSTPEGTDSAFYLVRQSNTKKIRMHWSAHPHKAIGLYRKTPDGMQLLDHKWHKNHPDYPFATGENVKGGDLRSPWYDEQCERRHTNQEIARELDINYDEAQEGVFDQNLLARVIARDAMEPFIQGDLIDGEFKQSPFGPLRLWINLDRNNKPNQDREYVIGMDISTGTGSSDSTMSVADTLDKVKIAEYTDNTLMPHEFAEKMHKFAKWFSTDKAQAFLIWEMNGPGGVFGKCLVGNLKYQHVWYHRQENDIRARRTGKYGWHMSKDSKSLLLGDYQRAISGQDFINRSERALRQCSQYKVRNGKIVSVKSIIGADKNEDNHGDLVIADALCAFAIGKYDSPEPAEKKLQHGCYAWRRKQWAMSQNKNSGWLDDDIQIDMDPY